ncbi:hypothetical protein R5R35_007893 [Gryllus longicercus]|uniref:Uncharacterized protein n=1 Tax=Gryllus longicercus TaxID=2509291 RepID=A0AAN9V888_9ORTH|nr:Uncharacterized protein GBIM_02748 [Gryllus bimaculatus]
MDNAVQVQELKEKGNACVRGQNYAESILHYTEAIKLDPQNFSLYSNRSLAFLKMQQFYLAMEDAKQTIRLKPDWAKGHFRKAEVEFQTFQFSDALLSYGRALQLQPEDPGLIEALRRASRESQRDQRADDQIPWLGAGVGIITGVLIVLADRILTRSPTLTHPILMVLLTLTIAMLGYAIARAFRYYVKCQRSSLLEPPLDLLEEMKQNEKNDKECQDDSSVPEVGKHERTHRYTKAQARQRYKKNKS